MFSVPYSLVAIHTWLLNVEPDLAYVMCQQSTGKCPHLGNTPVSLFSYVHGDIGPSTHWVSLRDALLDWICSFMRTPACLKNSAARRLRTYTRHVPACFRRRGGRRGSLSETHIKIFWTILISLVCMVPACSPAPPQVGVSGGVRPSAPAAAPSGGGPGRCTAERAGCYPPHLVTSHQVPS